jgi:hypothetical protein
MQHSSIQNDSNSDDFKKAEQEAQSQGTPQSQAVNLWENLSDSSFTP